MKMNKKKILSLTLVILLIATLSFGTLAWFNDSDAVTNKFKVAYDDTNGDGNVTPDEVFSVDVWEYVDGDTTTPDQDGHTYENVLPGSRLHKEPYIENTGAYDQYVRAIVTVTNADAWIAALGNGYDLGTMFEGHDESAWTRYDVGVYNPAENTYTMTFYLNYKLEPDAKACLFHTVVIPSELDQNDMVFIGGEFDLTIRAEAVQTENLGEGVDTAYEAFQVVGEVTN